MLLIIITSLFVLSIPQICEIFNNIRNSAGFSHAPLVLWCCIKEKNPNWLNVSRLQLPLHNLGLDSRNSISKTSDFVNLISASVGKLMCRKESNINTEKLYKQYTQLLRAQLIDAQGVQLKLIQQWMGHSNISTTVNVRNPHTNKM